MEDAPILIMTDVPATRRKWLHYAVSPAGNTLRAEARFSRLLDWCAAEDFTHLRVDTGGHLYDVQLQKVK